MSGISKLLRRTSLSLAALCASLNAGDFIIADAGTARSAIAIPDDAPALTRRAAAELQSFLERMSGARLPVAASGTIRLGFDTAGYRTDEIHLWCDGETLNLTGGGERGPLYAVYELLRQLGCAWPLPGELWLEIPERSTVAVPAMDFRSQPYFSVRGVHQSGGGELFHWMAFNRLNYRLQNPPGWEGAATMRSFGVEPFFISHTYGFWATRRALNEHLEWNPLLDGKRTPPSLEGSPWWELSQLCLGNPELRRHLIANMLAYLAEHPEMTTISMEANDGGGYCECDLCLRYGATVSDQVFRFTAEAATAIGEAFPGVRCLILSYGEHEELPPFRMPDNVWFGVVSNGRDYTRPLSAPENAAFLERLTEWARAYPGRVYIYELWKKVFFENYLHPYDRVFAADMRLYRDLGLAGIEPEGLHPSPTLEYLRQALCWDPGADDGAVVAELCRRIYGGGAEAMIAYYRLLDDRIAAYGRNLNSMTTYGEFAKPIAGEATHLLATALAAAGGDTPAAKRAVRRIEFELAQFNAAKACAEIWGPATELPKELRRHNLLPNGGFENGMTGVTVNTQYGDFDYAIVEDGACEGRAYGEIRVLKPGWGRMIQTASGLDPARKYAVLAAVKTAGGADMAHFWLLSEGLPAQLYRLGDTGGNWYRLILRDVAAPQGAISLFLTVHSDPDSGRVGYDDLMVVDQEIFDRLCPGE